MKRILILVVGLLLVGLSFAPANADLGGSAVASVLVTVSPNIAITPLSPIVDAGTVQSGDFTATLVFAIGANMESIKMFVEGSSLYKGDNPLDNTVSPIGINVTKPVGITIQFGNRMNGLPNQAAWTSVVGAPIGAYPTLSTETVQYESSQNGHFSQNVSLVLTYSQPDPEKPQGQYSGKVRLNVLLPL